VLRGLEYLHKSYATLPWRDLLQPAIHLAREGFIVNADLARVFSEVGTFLVDNPAWAIDFAPNGTLVGIGDTLTRKRYADLLETIAEEGPDVFYNGHIANTTISALQAANGTMTLEDLSEYSIVIREPVKITYRDFTLTTCGAPAGGAVVLSVMKTVEGYEDFGQPSSLNISTHRFDEAMRFGYGAVSLPSFCQSCLFADNTRGLSWVIRRSWPMLLSSKKKCSSQALQKRSGLKSQTNTLYPFQHTIRTASRVWRPLALRKLSLRTDQA
jgi:Gamma-glutamyltranspeptidase